MCVFVTAVDGGWSTWGAWSDCSASCASGAMYRSRICSNPKPNCAGLVCTGNYTDQAPCGSGFTCPGQYHSPRLQTFYCNVHTCWCIRKLHFLKRSVVWFM